MHKCFIACSCKYMDGAGGGELFIFPFEAFGGGGGELEIRYDT